jgi:hypothetical protein
MKIKQILTIAIVFLGIASFAISSPVFATSSDGGNMSLIGSASNKCEGVDTNIINCESNGEDGIEGTGLWNLLLTAINILSAGIGIAAVGGVVYAAVLYSSAGANADNIKKAKGMFVNIGIGIVAYLLMYSFLNYLIPGGLFN